MDTPAAWQSTDPWPTAHSPRPAKRAQRHRLTPCGSLRNPHAIRFLSRKVLSGLRTSALNSCPSLVPATSPALNFLRACGVSQHPDLSVSGRQQNSEDCTFFGELHGEGRLSMSVYPQPNITGERWTEKEETKDQTQGAQR